MSEARLVDDGQNNSVNSGGKWWRVVLSCLNPIKRRRVAEWPVIDEIDGGVEELNVDVADNYGDGATNKLSAISSCCVHAA